VRALESSTPHPPPSPEFGPVEPGGPAHHYPSVGGTGVRKLSVGPLSNNVYVIEAGGEALIIDGADEAPRILSEVEELRVVGVAQTHNHPDHTGALRELVQALDVPVYSHPRDPMPVAAVPIADGDSIDVGGAVVRSLHTPGHTPGSTCFLLGEFAFTGDTLFPGGPGATGGDRARFASIMAGLDRLFALPDATRICPGHGLDTTIGRERRHLDVWRARGW
jgi:glyoxylase-like metal-dependent hydrolase (beta-lactamase superfamily II)